MLWVYLGAGLWFALSAFHFAVTFNEARHDRRSGRPHPSLPWLLFDSALWPAMLIVLAFVPRWRK